MHSDMDKNNKAAVLKYMLPMCRMSFEFDVVDETGYPISKYKFLYYSLPLYRFVVKGRVRDFDHLKSKFISWCFSFGISQEQSIAMWHAGKDDNTEETINIAMSAYKLLPPVREKRLRKTLN
jgi:hypothetical protein